MASYVLRQLDADLIRRARDRARAAGTTLDTILVHALREYVADAAPGLSPDQIRAIRARLGENTATFGARVGVSGRTIENWEQGRRQPSASARRWLAQLQSD